MGVERSLGMLEMSSDEYFALPNVSQSFLKLYLDSPFHAKNPRRRESTKDQEFGTQFHELLMQPALYANSYIEEPIYQFDGRKTEGKAEREAFRVASNGRKVIVREDQLIQANMVEATFADPIASQLFSAGQAEKALIWQDEIGGVWCKARLDWLPDAVDNLIVDVKTTRSANPDELRRSVVKWGYHIQDSFYRRGWKAVFGTEPDFIFSFHEKPKHPDDLPVPPVLIELDRSFRMAGDRVVAKLLEQHVACTEANDWPSYTSGITLLSPPSWFKE